MKIKLHVLTLALMNLFFLLSCKQAAQRVVDVSTSAILREVYMEIKEGSELGEIVLGSPNKKITLEVTNYSSEVIRKMTLVIDDTQSSLKFMPNKDELVASPGGGGTCGTQLASGEKCTYVLNFIAKKAGVFNIPLTFNYENYIKAEKKIIYVKAVTGEVANLILTSSSSKFNFGVLEQTEKIEKTQTIEIQNTGDLSAREINYKIINSDEDNKPISIKQNNCPSYLNSKEKCTIIISYQTLGSSDSEPEKTYTAELPITYKKDSEGNIDALTASFNYTANTIEAKLDTSFSSIEFDKLVVGNKQNRIFKIINNGHKSGFIKKLHFKKNGSNDVYATCSKGVDKNLECTTNAYNQCLIDKKSNSNLNCSQSHKDFPFKIEDTDNCLNPLNSNSNEIAGIKPGFEGGSCLFTITYWPSIAYLDSTLALNNFNNSTLSVEFDSRWKNLETIRTKNNLFKINANFKTKAKIVFESVKFGEEEVNTSLATGSYHMAELGNIATIRADAIATGTTKVEITLKNIGEEKIDLQKITDGAENPHVITESAANINQYYRSVKYESLCTQLLPDATCKITYDLTPIDVSNLAEKNPFYYMYDDYSNLNAKYKIFKILYKDGSSINDDNSSVQDSISEIRLYSNQVSRGILKFVNSSPVDFGTIISGSTSSSQKIILQNIGVGDVKAIVKARNNQSWVDRPITDTNILLYNQWPFKSVAADSGEKDCKTLIYDSFPGETLDLDSTKYLKSGETCTLKIEAIGSDLYRQSTYSKEFERVFNSTINSTTELWERLSYSFTTIQKDKTCQLLNNCTIYGLNFEYYDGDLDGIPANSGNKNGRKKQIFPIPSAATASDPGFPIKNYSNENYMNMKVVIQKPPYLIFLNPRPIHSSLIIRPSLNYLGLNTTYSEKSIPFSSFSNGETQAITGQEPIYTKASISKNFINTISEITNTEDSIYYFGTIKTGDSFEGKVDIKNLGDVTAKNFLITLDNGGSSLITTPSSIPDISKGSGAELKFNIDARNTSTTGLVKKCLIINYENQITLTSKWNQRLCIYANIVNDSPSINIMVSAPNEMGLSQTLPRNLNYTDGSLKLSDTTDSKSTFFTAYYNGSGTSRTFTINNSSQTSTVRNLKFYLVDDTLQISPNKINANNQALTEITKYQSIGTVNGDTNCTYGNLNLSSTTSTTLPPGSFCSIKLNFKPVSQDTLIEDKDGYLVIVYDSATSNDGRSLQQNMEYISLKFRPQRLESLSIASVNGQPTSESNINPFPALPSVQNGKWIISETEKNNSLARKSSIIPIGNYLKGSVNGYKLNNQTGIVINNIIVKNESSHFAKIIPNGCTKETISNSTCPIAYSAIDGEQWALIKQTNEATIKGNDHCFKDSGFNKNTEKCKLQITFKGKITYQRPTTSSCSTEETINNIKRYNVTPNYGGRIDDLCNPYLYTLSYTMEDTENQFNLHISGFIEPEQTESSQSQITNITSTNANGKGKITFTVPASSSYSSLTNNSNAKYRIFYSTNLQKILSDDIFKNSALSDTDFNKIDNKFSTKTSANTTEGTNSKTFSIENLTPKNLYYFRLGILKKITINGKEIIYISATNSPILPIPTPHSDEFYSDVSKKLIDISDQSNLALDQNSATNSCKSINGSYSSTIKKKLINSADWKSILDLYPENNECTTSNSSACYPAHWTYDTPVDFSDLSLEDKKISDYLNNTYSLSEIFNSDSTYNNDIRIRYSIDKYKENNLLYKIVGYKIGISPQLGVLYTNKSMTSGNGLKIRCSTDLADTPCPIARTPAASSILDPKCTLDQ
jgi:hypothetical protein